MKAHFFDLYLLKLQNKYNFGILFIKIVYKDVIKSSAVPSKRQKNYIHLPQSLILLRLFPFPLHTLQHPLQRDSKSTPRRLHNHTEHHPRNTLVRIRLQSSP
jgi:hypothetical protein